MKHKITFKNITSYLEGNTQRILEELKLQPRHIQEQIAYRRLQCKDDCAISKECIKCGCDFKGKTSVVESCNPEKFPNLMSKQEWYKYKEDEIHDRREN
jgi:hypothetical protein